MIIEHSLMRLIKVAAFLVFLSICQSEARRDVSSCSNIDEGLPCDEVYALRAVMEELKPSRWRQIAAGPQISGKYCENRGGPINITCNCNKNKTVCHVTGISANDELWGCIHDDVSKLTYLETLDLSQNHLRCTIPASLGNLKSLANLDLSYNFIQGHIPPSLGNLSSLRFLYLWSNTLSGPIPKEFGKLSNIAELDLGKNRLNGHLPWELGNLTKLEILGLYSNNFTGEIPDNYSKLKSIQYFGADGNRLTGTIPKFISEWTDLVSLYISGNDFEGPVPAEIFTMPNLEQLWISDLRNPGFSFPPNANLKNINKLRMRNCSINGSIPEYIGHWPSLKYLDLSFNKLTGPIPKFTQNLSTLILAENELSGPIPSVSTQYLDLAYNNFPIQSLESNGSEEGIFPGIAHLNIKPNRNFTLEAKHKYCQGKSKYYNLSINCGGPRIRSDDGNWWYEYDEDTSLEKFHVSPDKRWAYSCTGDFSSAFGNESDYIRKVTCGVSDEPDKLQTARFCPVALKYYGFCLHKGSYHVSLHFAEVVFTNDEDYTSSGVRVFDVYIQGKIQLHDFNIRDETKNTTDPWTFQVQLDEDPLEILFFWSGKGSVMYDNLQGPLVSAIRVTPNFKIPGHHKLRTLQIIGISLGSALAAVLALAFAWKMGWLGNRELKEVHIEVDGRRYTLEQIIDATRKFSPRMEIGKGRFGFVYKAELPDQTKLAVKKISPELTQDKLKYELQGEIFFNLKSIKHDNLVQLYGGYSKKDLHLLIYEYMDNGSLHHALFDPNSTMELDWKVRFDICLALAKALKYLHEENGLKIIHRNVKPSNILLDQSFTAKLTDFGWARLYNEEDPFMTIKAGAARVYIAPEYALGQPITDKADVYSFGVVTLEIFSGRLSVINKANQEAAYLIDDARIAQAKGRIYELFDTKLVITDRKVALTILNLAIMCIHPTADLRPSMSEVVSVLSGEKSIDEISKAHTA